MQSERERRAAVRAALPSFEARGLEAGQPSVLGEDALDVCVLGVTTILQGDYAFSNQANIGAQPLGHDIDVPAAVFSVPQSRMDDRCTFTFRHWRLAAW